jgi:hypothetical protein
MTPAIIEDHAESCDTHVGIAQLKANIKTSTRAIDIHGSDDPPPVADDYMYDFKYNHPLPTTGLVGIEIPQDCDAQTEAGNIVESLSTALAVADAEAFTSLFLDYGSVYAKFRVSHQMSLTIQCRCLARQARLHMGSTHIQLSSSDTESCRGSALADQGFKLWVFGTSPKGRSSIRRFRSIADRGIFRD